MKQRYRAQLRLTRTLGEEYLYGHTSASLVLIDASTGDVADEYDIGKNVDSDPAIVVSGDKTAVCVTYSCQSGEYAACAADVLEVGPDGRWQHLFSHVQEPKGSLAFQPPPRVRWSGWPTPSVTLKWRQRLRGKWFPSVVQRIPRAPARGVRIVSCEVSGDTK